MGLAEEILKRVGSSKELMKSVAHALKGLQIHQIIFQTQLTQHTKLPVVGMSMVLAGVDRLEDKINGTNY